MAETTGLVQRVTVVSNTLTCVWIGPTPNNNELLIVSNNDSASDTAFAANLIHTLVAAATNYRVVTATHADNDSKITQVRIDPV